MAARATCSARSSEAVANGARPKLLRPGVPARTNRSITSQAQPTTGTMASRISQPVRLRSWARLATAATTVQAVKAATTMGAILTTARATAPPGAATWGNPKSWPNSWTYLADKSAATSIRTTASSTSMKPARLRRPLNPNRVASIGRNLPGRSIDAVLAPPREERRTRLDCNRRHGTHVWVNARQPDLVRPDCRRQPSSADRCSSVG